MYDAEGVPLEGIVFPDNRPCCDLLEKSACVESNDK